MNSREPSAISGKRYIVLIGDLLSSRGVIDRIGVQARLHDAMEQCNTQHRCLVSPYTITLGDEFQAVLSCADFVFTDAITILLALYPTRIRFSIGVGILTTPINNNQAIGMDGPAFHLARDGITKLKKSGGLFAVTGLPVEYQPLVQHTLDLISHEVKTRWNYRYLRTYLGLNAKLLNDKSSYGKGVVRHTAAELQITESGVYRLIEVGAIRVIRSLFGDISETLNHAVGESGE